jgi:hypothetical protein
MEPYFVSKINFRISMENNIENMFSSIKTLSVGIWDFLEILKEEL